MSFPLHPGSIVIVLPSPVVHHTETVDAGNSIWGYAYIIPSCNVASIQQWVCQTTTQNKGILRNAHFAKSATQQCEFLWGDIRKFGDPNKMYPKQAPHGFNGSNECAADSLCGLIRVFQHRFPRLNPAKTQIWRAIIFLAETNFILFLGVSWIKTEKLFTKLVGQETRVQYPGAILGWQAGYHPTPAVTGMS